MKAIVTGGRDFRDARALFEEMDSIHERTPISFLIEGGQRKYVDGILVGGVDYWARRWAQSRNVECITVEADWNNVDVPGAVIGRTGNGRQYNKNAGPARNQRMIDEHSPDVVIKFPGGKGTADMVRRARAAGIDLIEVKL